MATNPEFEQYKQLFAAGQFGEALATLDRLLGDFPESASLHWHRARCLEKLKRHEEVPAALNRFLEKQPDYVPAILKRVEYSAVSLDIAAPYPEDPDEDGLSSAERARRKDAADLRDRLERETTERNELDLRRILTLEPDNARAIFLLSSLLLARDGADSAIASRQKAHELLDQAIALDPECIEYREARAGAKRAQAVVITDDTPPPEDPNLVRTFVGMTYRRNLLEEAVRDYEFCWQRSGEIRHGLQLGSILHDLGRYDEALRRHDEVLGTMAADDPRRDLVAERRARSENNGAGEREQMANLLLSSLAEPGGKDRTQQEDMAAQAILGTAEAIRRGAPVSDAIAGNLSDDPETMAVMNIARQIVNLANEPAPGLQPADPANYPAFQRKHCDEVERVAMRIGLQKIADAEAHGMFNMLGSHVLLRIFKNAQGEIGMASFAMKPKWPGMLVFLFLLVTGKWRAYKMTECVTHFDDGSLISTQPESISPFDYGGKIRMIKLPPQASVEEIYQTHVRAVAEFRAANPAAKPMIVNDVPGVEARWIAGQESKAAYRKSIGYVSDSELRRLLGGHYERFAPKVRALIHSMTAL